MSTTKTKTSRLCEYGDDGACPNAARQEWRGRKICNRHRVRVQRTGKPGGVGSRLVGRRVEKPQNKTLARAGERLRELYAAEKLIEVVKATGWRTSVANKSHGHGRRLEGSRGNVRVSRMMLASWMGRGWITAESETLNLTKEGAAVVAKWK